MKNLKLIVTFIIIFLIILYAPFFTQGNYEEAGDNIESISEPKGYARIESDDYGKFIRSLPLKNEDARVMYYTGGEASQSTQRRSYRIVDIPLLSNAEQCADVCMRLRAEYLYRHGKYFSIHFETKEKVPLVYLGGRSRTLFEIYMKSIYEMCNTATLANQLKTRKLKNIKVGDVFVYPARPGHKYGHAIMVVDVAKNPDNEKTVVLLAEGNTPANEIHLIANRNSSRLNPWHTIDEASEILHFGPFKYYSNELKHY